MGQQWVRVDISLVIGEVVGYLPCRSVPTSHGIVEKRRPRRDAALRRNLSGALHR